MSQQTNNNNKQQQQAHEHHHWGYSHDSVAPNEWPKYYETGVHQSPINILVSSSSNLNSNEHTHSTCCHGRQIIVELNDGGEMNKQMQRRHRNLPERLRDALKLKSSSKDQHHHQRHRSHLDSVGEEEKHRESSSMSLKQQQQQQQHKRSVSSSSSNASSKDNGISSNSSSGSSGGSSLSNSAATSSSSSPTHDDDGDEEDDDDDAYDDGRMYDQRGSYNHQSGNSSPSYSSYNGDEQEDALRRRRDNNNGKKCKGNINNSQQQQKLTTPSMTQQQQQRTRFCVSHKKIFLGYPRYLNNMQLCNTGHSWQVNLPGELANHTLLSGPPLGDREYRLAQLHCHWGEDCDHGSEHQINGKYYSAEIHFVHWNCTDFKSMEEAAKHKHGLAVLGVLVQALEGEQNQNKHLEKIIAGLKRVQKPNSSVSLQDARLDLKKLFPTNRWNYASYEGSLTTPPLSEVVDWIVFLNPIQCSTRQIEHFRQIRCPSQVNNSGGGNQLLNNCRPIQPTNNRLVSIWSHH